ncbi:DUF7537 family lipoprotein [Halobaculum magnesiiphilum]|uniref:Uncharacterized protein n=1 Tax=Halobaculum magnesiiphilum TaxID=1017351 RepID=A0A8T8WDC2_9EURY|nr:hypothetical protein [Halobaculum magnesiiphilum]QZP37840.1 hypothetical protein K6T50_01280 [Halobaculum magnesiiphilum]
MGAGTRRSLWIAAGVALLVVLAGCTGGGAPYDGPPSAEDVEDGHEEAIRDAGSYTYNQTVSVNGSVIDVTSNTTAAVELDPETYVWEQETGDGSLSVYAPADDRPYVRTRAGNTIRYDRPENESVPNVSGFTTPPVAELAGAFDFSANGTAQVDGTRTYVYEANVSTLNESAVGHVGEALADAEATDATVEVYVRSDGLVKRVDWQVVVEGLGEPTRLSVTITYENVGSTTVEEPSWLEEAKSATS